MTRRADSIAQLLTRHWANALLRDEAGLVLSYGDVLQLAKSDALIGTHRSLVMCLVNNEIGGLAGYLALLAAGAVPMMCSPTLQREALDPLLAAYQPEYLWTHESNLSAWPRSTLLTQFHGYCLLALAETGEALHPSLALLLSTSGSTGSGKYVRLSMHNLLSNADSITSYLGLTDDELPITTLPPNYSYGLSIIHSHLLAGAGLAVTNKTFFDREFWSFLRDVKATSIAGVPYQYEILKKLRFIRMPLPSLRYLTQAGGRMDPTLTHEYATHCAQSGMRFFSMYGQTEATARMSFVPAAQASAKAGSIGVPVPGGSFELRDRDGAILSDAESPGELVYRGPNVCMGYASSRADLAEGDVNRGVLHTGDLAKRDADGYYYIVGRKTRFIKLFGNRINLQDVEQLLSAQGVAAACSGRDDVLEIYLASADALMALELKKTIAQRLHVAVQGVVLYGLPALPRSESGKIRYAELRPEKAQLLA